MKGEVLQIKMVAVHFTTEFLANLTHTQKAAHKESHIFAKISLN